MPHAVVAVAPSKQTRGFIAQSEKMVPKTYSMVHFDDILNAMIFTIKDRLFLVGNHVIKRKDGWAMGGFMSSSATCVTLEHDINNLYTKTATARETGWLIPGIKWKKPYKD